MARKTKEEAERTRNAILDAAEKVFISRGISMSSIEDIAQNAGVTRGAFYWHFKNKLDLCDSLARRIFLPPEDMLQTLASKNTERPIDDLKDIALQSLYEIKTNKKKRDVFSLLFLRCEITEESALIIKRRNEGLSRTLVLMEQIFTRAYELEKLAPQWTPHLAAVAAQTLIIGVITAALESREDFQLTSVGAPCVEALFNALKKGEIERQ